MHPRASYLVESLALTPHPEGGYFREVFRSSSIVAAKASGAQRTAITSIYYLLAAGQVSKFHRVASDEVWHSLEGEPLELHVLDPDLAGMRTYLLGPVSANAQPICTVPADYWQAAMPRGAFALVGCTVGPGFEYEDFVLMANDAAVSERLKSRFPDLETLL